MTTSQIGLQKAVPLLPKNSGSTEHINTKGIIWTNQQNSQKNDQQLSDQHHQKLMISGSTSILNQKLIGSPPRLKSATLQQKQNNARFTTNTRSLKQIRQSAAVLCQNVRNSDMQLSNTMEQGVQVSGDNSPNTQTQILLQSQHERQLQQPMPVAASMVAYQNQDTKSVIRNSDLLQQEGQVDDGGEMSPLQQTTLNSNHTLLVGRQNNEGSEAASHIMLHTLAPGTIALFSETGQQSNEILSYHHQHMVSSLHQHTAASNTEEENNLMSPQLSPTEQEKKTQNQGSFQQLENQQTQQQHKYDEQQQFFIAKQLSEHRIRFSGEESTKKTTKQRQSSNQNSKQQQRTTTINGGAVNEFSEDHVEPITIDQHSSFDVGLIDYPQHLPVITKDSGPVKQQKQSDISNSLMARKAKRLKSANQRIMPSRGGTDQMFTSLFGARFVGNSGKSSQNNINNNIVPSMSSQDKRNNFLVLNAVTTHRVPSANPPKPQNFPQHHHRPMIAMTKQSSNHYTAATTTNLDSQQVLTSSKINVSNSQEIMNQQQQQQLQQSSLNRSGNQNNRIQKSNPEFMIGNFVNMPMKEEHQQRLVKNDTKESIGAKIPTPSSNHHHHLVGSKNQQKKGLTSSKKVNIEVHIGKNTPSSTRKANKQNPTIANGNCHRKQTNAAVTNPAMFVPQNFVVGRNFTGQKPNEISKNQSSVYSKKFQTINVEIDGTSQNLNNTFKSTLKKPGSKLEFINIAKNATELNSLQPQQQQQQLSKFNRRSRQRYPEETRESQQLCVQQQDQGVIISQEFRVSQQKNRDEITAQRGGFKDSGANPNAESDQFRQRPSSMMSRIGGDSIVNHTGNKLQNKDLLKTIEHAVARNKNTSSPMIEQFPFYHRHSRQGSRNDNDINKKKDCSYHLSRVSPHTPTGYNEDLISVKILGQQRTSNATNNKVPILRVDNLDANTKAHEQQKYEQQSNDLGININENGLQYKNSSAKVGTIGLNGKLGQKGRIPLTSVAATKTQKDQVVKIINLQPNFAAKSASNSARPILVNNAVSASFRKPKPPSKQYQQPQNGGGFIDKLISPQRISSKQAPAAKVGQSAKTDQESTKNEKKVPIEMIYPQECEQQQDQMFLGIIQPKSPISIRNFNSNNLESADVLKSVDARTISLGILQESNGREDKNFEASLAESPRLKLMIDDDDLLSCGNNQSLRTTMAQIKLGQSNDPTLTKNSFGNMDFAMLSSEGARNYQSNTCRQKVLSFCNKLDNQLLDSVRNSNGDYQNNILVAYGPSTQLQVNTSPDIATTVNLSKESLMYLGDNLPIKPLQHSPKSKQQSKRVFSFQKEPTQTKKRKRKTLSTPNCNFPIKLSDVLIRYETQHIVSKNKGRKQIRRYKNHNHNNHSINVTHQRATSNCLTTTVNTLTNLSPELKLPSSRQMIQGRANVSRNASSTTANIPLQNQALVNVLQFEENSQGQQQQAAPLSLQQILKESIAGLKPIKIAPSTTKAILNKAVEPTIENDHLDQETIIQSARPLTLLRHVKLQMAENSLAQYKKKQKQSTSTVSSKMQEAKLSQTLQPPSQKRQFFLR